MSYSRIFRKMSFDSNLMTKFHKLQQIYPKINFFIGKQEISKIPINNEPKFFFGQCTKDLSKQYQQFMSTSDNLNDKGIIHWIPGCPADYKQALTKLMYSNK